MPTAKVKKVVKFIDTIIFVLWQMLLDWINDELAEQRIIVKDLEEDMFDGQILQKLIGIHQ